MNRVNLELLDKQSSVLDEKQEYLKQYGLDEESIREFRSKIKKVSVEEADRLGEKVWNTIYYYDWHGNYGDDIKEDEEVYSEILPYIIAGANINYISKSGIPLLFSCPYFFKSSTLLIKAGADINSKDIYGNTFIILLVNSSNKTFELLKIILLLGVNKEEQQRALIFAKSLEKLNRDEEKYIKLLEDAIQGKDIFSSCEKDKQSIENENRKLKEQTPEELLQEAEDRLNKVLGNTLTRKRSR